MSHSQQGGALDHMRLGMDVPPADKSSALTPASLCESR
jgi:hypothetical protein